MNGPITETANFAALTPITVTTNPAGLAVVVDGVTLTAPQEFVWIAGASHTIAVASPQASTGTQNVFSAWSDGGAQTHTVTTPATAVVYTANFTTQYSLTVTISPTGGGTVTASPTSAGGYYNAGTVVQLTAAGNTGYVFVNWSGDLTGSANPQSITMSTAHNVTANFTALSTAGLGYYPMTPCRLVDTRAGSDKTGQFGSPSLAGGASRSFALLSGGCNVPSTAQAYALNITAAPSGGALGYLTTWPTGSAQPVVSTLNSSDGAVTANAAIVPAGTGGAISVFVSNTADVIIDINGYFAPPTAQALAFYPVTPCRIADTRSGSGKTGAFGPPRQRAGYTDSVGRVRDTLHGTGLLVESHGCAARPAGIPDGVAHGPTVAGGLDRELVSGQGGGQCGHRYGGNQRVDWLICQRNHRCDCGHQWVLRAARHGRAVLLRGHAVPAGGYACGTRQIRGVRTTERAFQCRTGLPDSFGRLRDPVHGKGLLAEYDGGPAGDPDLPDHLADRSGPARGIDSE
jgi:uncharacterized repeat protein (TIGR02543 family)